MLDATRVQMPGIREQATTLRTPQPCTDAHMFAHTSLVPLPAEPPTPNCTLYRVPYIHVKQKHAATPYSTVTAARVATAAASALHTGLCCFQAAR
jgi:hypothetical protein